VLADRETDLRTRALGDLRAFIEIVRERGELEIVRGADPYLEMGALYELSLRVRYPRVLLFEAIPGYPPDYRVVVNVRFNRVFTGEFTLEALKAYRKRGKWEGAPIPPRTVATGPICSRVLTGDDVDVLAYPAPHWHEEDGGRYIGTECLVITKDRDSDWVNVGTYRVSVQDGRTLSVFIEDGKHGDLIRKKYWERGESAPMVVVVGQAPVLGIVAGNASRYGTSEFDTAGGMIGQPIDVVAGRITGLPIPADAELAFEGYMPPIEVASRLEGPFAEWPGYYASNAHPDAILDVRAIYQRDDPIITGQPPAKPTFPGRQPSLASMAALWDALEAAGIPGIKAVWKPDGSGSRFVNVIAIEQMYAGHAKQVGLVAAGCSPGAYLGRVTIVVDDDIDVTNHAEVMWALGTRWDPKTATDILDEAWTGEIDPLLSPEKRAAGHFTNSRAIIYAVRPYHWKDQFPRVNAVPLTYLHEVERKWIDTLAFLRDFRDRQG
jgi:4-hydroxy-3-polyprenylbenzoate decarboxylase